MPYNKKEISYRRLIDETGNQYMYDYLTIECSTRSKYTAARAKSYIKQGQYAKALKLADPIAYQSGLNDYTR